MNCDSSCKIVACGIDTESISRFLPFCRQSINPMPMVYSSYEYRLSLHHKNPAVFLCAAFCCKEAVFKALQKPYNFNTCVLGEITENKYHQLQVSDPVFKEANIDKIFARLFLAPGECSVCVLLACKH
ncbi:MAG: hypothetical protein A2096_12420 [Spirochaetes bacterium GWF1_41_5]|nr:MAG: hypothetical protein A2096_12420 [Spirochaetes bacterium GWF1_41_5]